jgi:hypothetical protein
VILCRQLCVTRCANAATLRSRTANGNRPHRGRPYDRAPPRTRLSAAGCSRRIQFGSSPVSRKCFSVIAAGLRGNRRRPRRLPAGAPRASHGQRRFRSDRPAVPDPLSVPRRPHLPNDDKDRWLLPAFSELYRALARDRFHGWADAYRFIRVGRRRVLIDFLCAASGGQMYLHRPRYEIVT